MSLHKPPPRRYPYLRRGPRRLIRIVRLTGPMLAAGLASGIGAFGGLEIILDERKKSVDIRNRFG